MLGNKDDTELLARLLYRKAAVDVPDKHGDYPVHKAAWYDSVTQLRMLKEAGATMSATVGKDALLEVPGMHGWLGATALHKAARAGQCEVLRFLLNSGMDPLAQMWNGATPLHCAV